MPRRPGNLLDSIVLEAGADVGRCLDSVSFAYIIISSFFLFPGDGSI